MICISCGKMFYISGARVRKGVAAYCSIKCRWASHPRKNCICEICKRRFTITSSRPRARFCSKKCFAKGMMGHPPSNWKGGRMTNNGYTSLLVKGHPYADRDGYVLEHRLIVEKKIGRYLIPDEIIHHKNEKPSDNRIENLELLKSQSIHMKLHKFGHKSSK
jgi:hypothetical protein